MFRRSHEVPARLTIWSRAVLLVGACLAGAPASADDTTCTPLNVMTFTNRVHVLCSESVGNIRYFAVSTSDSAHAARVLSILSSALAAGRTLSIVYDPADTSGEAFGCLAQDCRTIQAVAFWQ